jgi:hypothetical protein
MARHNDRPGILRKCRADIASQGAVAQSFGNFAIGQRCTRRNGARDIIDAPVEVRHIVTVDAHASQVSWLAADQPDNILDRVAIRCLGGGVS